MREDTRGGGGWVSACVEDNGRGEGRVGRRDGSPHARGHGRGRGMHPHPNLPPSRGKGGERGSGRGLCIREGVEGREYPAARFLEGLGMTCGVRWGDGRFANRPYGGGKGRGTGRGIGWVPACARTRVEEGFHPHPNLPPSRGKGGDRGGGLHPHPPSSRGQALAFPLEGGREGEGKGNGEGDAPPS